MKKIGLILLSIFFVLGLASLVNAQQDDDLVVTLTGRDQQMRHNEYRYKVSVYIPRWNQTRESYETETFIYYAKHWELDESKKYSSLEQNYLDGSTLYLTEKNRCIKIPNGARLDEKGEIHQGHYTYSLGGEFGYKIIIVDLNSDRIVWRNYEWDFF